MAAVSSTSKYAAEFFGTLALVLVGCGSAVVAGPQNGYTGISFAFGLTVLAMAYAIGPISGCHINPAITISMLTAGKISGKDAGMYIVSQILGGIAGAGILYLIVSGSEGFTMGEYALGSNGYGADYLGKYSMGSAFIAEVVFTFLFLLVIFGATSERANGAFAGLAIGLALVLIHLASINITGTSVNPARSLGPAIFAGGAALSQVWLFFVAPIIGGVLAAFVWKGVLNK